MSIDLAALLANPEAIVGNAARFWLVPGRAAHGRHSPSNRERIEGFADGNVIRFLNVPMLETRTYTLMWTSLRDHDHPIRPQVCLADESDEHGNGAEQAHYEIDMLTVEHRGRRSPFPFIVGCFHRSLLGRDSRKRRSPRATSSQAESRSGQLVIGAPPVGNI